MNSPPKPGCFIQASGGFLLSGRCAGCYLGVLVGKCPGMVAEVRCCLLRLAIVINMTLWSILKYGPARLRDEFFVATGFLENSGMTDSSTLVQVAHGRWARVIFGAILVITGLVLGAGGVRLASLGGSWYYLASGVAFFLSGVLLWRGNALGGMALRCDAGLDAGLGTGRSRY